MKFTHHDCTRIAASTGCSISTVLRYVTKARKTNPVIARSIEKAILELGIQPVEQTESKEAST